MLIKVAWLSSYPPRRCGLANYSFEYLQALRRLANVEVISHVKNGRDGTYSIVNLEDPQWWKRVDELIAKISPDVVHIQHAFDLWGIRDDNMPLLELIRSLKHRALPIVITYHNPFDNLSGVKRRFAVESLKLIDVCVLHCEYQIATLPVKPKQVKIIPHGSKEGIKLAKEACREALGLSNWKYVVGTAGLYSRRKQFERLIEIWPRIREKSPEGTALFMGVIPHHFDDEVELKRRFEDLITASPERNSIVLRFLEKYTSESYDAVLGSMDIFLLPYLEETQSGAFARAISVGVPMVVLDVGGLGIEARESGAGIALKTLDEFPEVLGELLRDPRRRRRMSENATKYLNEVKGWSLIAEETVRVYENLLAEQASRG